MEEEFPVKREIIRQEEDDNLSPPPKLPLKSIEKQALQ